MYAVVDELPGNALEDVFLVLMLCCYTARHHVLAESLVAKGADLVVGFCEDLNLNAYPEWIRGFLAALENGKSIGKAILAGIDMVDDDDKPALSSFRVFNGPGASANDKLLPARYGRKSGTRQVS
jgi:hypothetical protein